MANYFCSFMKLLRGRLAGTFQKLLFSAVAALGLTGCSTKIEKPASAELARLAGDIESYQQRRDPTLLNSIFSEAAFDREVEKRNGGRLGVDARISVEDRLSMKKLGSELLQVLGQPGRYKVLRSFQDSRGRHLLFRMLTNDGQLDYHDYLIVKADGELKAADFYDYFTGMWVSEKVLYNTAIRSDGGRILSGNKQFGEQREHLKAIQQQLEAEKYRSALAGIKALPGSIRSLPFAVRMTLEAAEGLRDDSLYLETLNASSPHYDSRWSLMVMTTCLQTGRYNKALQALETLDRVVGGDPYLDYYRGPILYSLGHQDAFITAVQRLLDYEPAIPEIYIPYMEVLLQERRFKEIGEAIRTYRGQLDFEQSSLDSFLAARPEIPDSLRRAGQRQ